VEPARRANHRVVSTALGLAGVSDLDGGLAVLAIDHRDSLKRFLRPSDPDSVTRSEIIDLKTELVRVVGPHATGIMLEPEFSIPNLIDDGVVPDGVGFFAALESQGYLDDPGAAPTTLLDGWSVAAAKASGASMAKLLLPYHPDHHLARAQEAVAAEVIAECDRVGLPLALEPLFFGLDRRESRPEVVLATVERFAAAGPALLKLPFPVDPSVEADRSVWGHWCRAITERCDMPWAMLSGGGSFDDFEAQVGVAIDAGCSGFMVGRALWGEAALAAGAERSRLIDDLIVPRFQRLRTRLK
jgi:tagatose 1,6-diphosphate aldolase